MAQQISSSFLAQMNADIKLAYQQFGSKMKNTTYFKTCQGTTMDFKKMGTGEAAQKSRHGNVPVMNATQTKVTATMADWYAGDYADLLDLEKINHDEKAAIVRTAVGALGRKVDSLIINQLDDTTNTIGSGGTGLSRPKVLEAMADLMGNGVPLDGNIFCVVGAHQWAELYNIAEFKSADYVGPNNLPWVRGGEQMKYWMGIYWYPHNYLPFADGSTAGDRACFMYHRDAIGYAENSDIRTFIDWVPEKAAWFVDNMVSGGAILIDEDGVIEIACDDDVAIS